MKLSGDVTTYAAIASVAFDEVERRIGYRPGRLAKGYDVYELCEPVAVGEFDWTDTTSYSGGWQYQRDADEYARRTDILRADLGKRFGYQEAVVDAELDRFLASHASKLNVRSGPARIVKILPVTRHDPNMFWLDQYPNAQVRGTPQWTLHRDRPKLFQKIATVPPGGMLS
ncbi:hypothetical protein [Sphingomonas sp.]|jgi:hypothetical protein|uniref:hypothetical protein n=1 Tax=Sphingomonas sp. TaxID=28214 RepID=UPI002D804308|nr:hypothetical protein [Sphingomonas sp.]HEU0045209.1 hypothetical protein [Sphingomonas sp.]